MWQNELPCLVILLGKSPLLYWSLWTRPKLVASAVLSIPYRDQPVPQEFPPLSVRESVRPRCGPHESLPNLFVIQILCDSMIMFS